MFLILILALLACLHAAPSTTARSAPTGKFIKEGFPCKLAFARLPAANFWERVVGSPSIDGGDAIDITTHFNLKARTKEFRRLYEHGEFTVQAMVDPLLKTQIKNTLINQNGAITRHYPDGTTEDFFGALRMAEFSEDDSGEPMIVTLTVTPSSYDPANRVESEFVVTEVAGT